MVIFFSIWALWFLLCLYFHWNFLWGNSFRFRFKVPSFKEYVHFYKMLGSFTNVNPVKSKFKPKIIWFPASKLRTVGILKEYYYFSPQASQAKDKSRSNLAVIDGTVWGSCLQSGFFWSDCPLCRVFRPFLGLLLKPKFYSIRMSLLTSLFLSE